MGDVSVVRSEQLGDSGLPEILGSSSSACSNGLDLSANVTIQEEEEKPGWRKFLAHIGPGFLVCIAYLDPGNIESDLQAGALYKYELLWIILVASIFAVIIQSRAANLGVTTGKHLAEHYREEYPIKINYILWLLAESAVIAADIPEVLGTAFALNMMFHIPVWVGVLITGLSTLLLLGMQRFGIRKLEWFVAFLILVMFGCFFGELAYAKPEPKEVVKGLFVPLLNGNEAIGLAISLLGAMIMPHNLFLHSALVLSRKVTPSASGINQVLGGWSSKVFAIALLASGQSSTITGTYAGQYVMQGFLNLEMKRWLRNFITRSIAIIPSLVVSVISGSSGAGRLIIISSMILSFELPFALIPLLKFTSSKTKMGPYKSSTTIMVVAWFIGWCITGINIYYLSTIFGEWLIHNNLPKLASIFIGLMVFPIMALYLVGVLYLALRRNKNIADMSLAESLVQNPSNPER